METYYIYKFWQYLKTQDSNNVNEVFEVMLKKDNLFYCKQLFCNDNNILKWEVSIPNGGLLIVTFGDKYFLYKSDQEKLVQEKEGSRTDITLEPYEEIEDVKDPDYSSPRLN
ncbi:hypothetical protein [Zunongwangia atlantica]|uniref:Uncharacterized protein n=1 Tax=Zunongwangia atlantica 22II14-10F7 TaxID=1185767 RepID=A0A1Y1T2Y7_9FLAO|nr:hypothetical protein [Zunongwangia atlantica]ORL45381.1 hypothetical protein IIF7_11183 [Zunongwangia atlantica 22II14-10F7]